MAKTTITAPDLNHLFDILFEESHRIGNEPIMPGAKGLVVGYDMWHSAPDSLQVCFLNMARVHNLPYKVSRFDTGTPYLTDEWEEEAGS